MNAGEVSQLIERYNTAWNAQDLDTIHELHHPEIVFDNHTAAERAEGADAVREHIAKIFGNNPGMTFRTRSMYTGEDFAAREWTLHSRRTGVQIDRRRGRFPIRNGLARRTCTRRRIVPANCELQHIRPVVVSDRIEALPLGE
jgi:ketosteroid isomerase-like protein